MIKRLLVTTALEETWGDGVPVIFLGEWCRPYNRKHIWSKMDALVAQPFCVQPEQKLSEMDYVSGLVKQILTELTEGLNKYHQVQHNERYWNIVLGHWLKRYINFAFNCYYTLDQALKNYEVAGTVVFMNGDYELATSDSWDFIHRVADYKWTYTFYSRIMSFRGDIELSQVSTPLGWVERYYIEPNVASDLSQGIAGRMVKKLSLALASMGTKFYSDSEAFIIGSYLPFKEEIKLQLALGQVPKLWETPSIKPIKADSGQRARLKLNYDHFDGFEKYVRWQLPEVVPICYLEGYKGLIQVAEKMKWPEKPKFIFTSNSFDTNEVFKLWAASKVEQGTPYFAGQHGNNYGSHVACGNSYWPERATSDKLITWGWAESEKDIPAFILNCAGKKPRQFDGAGGLLLIERPLLSAVNILGGDSYCEFVLYMEEQFRFAENLTERIHQKLTVRLHNDYLRFRTFDDLRWKHRSPHTQLELGIINIRELIKLNRLVVHSYDSTGILETLAMNIPTMCFWRGGLSHLLPRAKPFYELLVDAGILFFSPEATAKSIALHWDDISGWWESKRVQDARQLFCQQYARTVAHPVRELKNLLKANS